MDDIPAVPARPPAAPAGPNIPGEVRWLVVQSWQLGAYDASGKRTPRGWADLGFDLDHRLTTQALSKSGSESCTRLEGSPNSIATDGRDGIDNQFGSQLVPLLYAACPSTLHGNIPVRDSFTLLLRLDDAATADDPSAPGSLFVLRRSVGEDWTLDDALLEKGEFVSKIRFPGGFVRDGRWWSGPSGMHLPLELPLCGASVPLDLELGALSVELDGGAGMLGGFARSTAIDAGLGVLLRVNGACPGTSTYDQFVHTVILGLDVVADAPNLQEVGRVCDSLTVGLGFVAEPMTPPRAHGPFVRPEAVDECKKP
ncbi:MAG: hypothetical protein IPJ34_40595 [Myxococcales bacterium]|nr:hypothetical protein [Myxococcales bacterium]